MNSTDLSTLAPIPYKATRPRIIQQTNCDDSKRYGASSSCESILPSNAGEWVRNITKIVQCNRQPVRVRSHWRTIKRCAAAGEIVLLNDDRKNACRRFFRYNAILSWAGRSASRFRHLIADLRFQMTKSDHEPASNLFSRFFGPGALGKRSHSDRHGPLLGGNLSVNLLDLTGNNHITDVENYRIRRFFSGQSPSGIMAEIRLWLICVIGEAACPDQLKQRILPGNKPAPELIVSKALFNPEGLLISGDAHG